MKKCGCPNCCNPLTDKNGDLPDSEFTKDIYSKDKLRYRCRHCEKYFYYNPIVIEVFPEGWKRCSKGDNCCNPNKNEKGLLLYDQYYKSKNGVGGVAGACKMCLCKDKRDKKAAENLFLPFKEGHKKCSRLDCCNPNKDEEGWLDLETQFYNDKNTFDKKSPHCKHCGMLDDLERAEERRIYSKKRREIPEIQEHIKNYRLSRKEEDKIYQQNRKLTPEYKELQKIRKENGEIEKANKKSLQRYYKKKIEKEQLDKELGVIKIAFISKQENEIKLLLIQWYILFCHNFWDFDRLRSTKNPDYHLEIDFWLYYNKICIEFHGDHHLKPIHYSGNLTIQERLEQLKTQKANDQEKIRFCKQEGYKLIVIWWTDRHKIKEILIQELQMVNFLYLEFQYKMHHHQIFIL